MQPYDDLLVEAPQSRCKLFTSSKIVFGFCHFRQFTILVCDKSSTIRKQRCHLFSPCIKFLVQFTRAKYIVHIKDYEIHANFLCWFNLFPITEKLFPYRQVYLMASQLHNMNTAWFRGKLFLFVLYQGNKTYHSLLPTKYLIPHERANDAVFNWMQWAQL